MPEKVQIFEIHISNFRNNWGRYTNIPSIICLKWISIISESATLTTYNIDDEKFWSVFFSLTTITLTKSVSHEVKFTCRRDWVNKHLQPRMYTILTHIYHTLHLHLGLFFYVTYLTTSFPSISTSISHNSVLKVIQIAIYIQLLAF